MQPPPGGEAPPEGESGEGKEGESTVEGEFREV